MKDYVVRFIEALYGSKTDEDGAYWKDVYMYEMEEIVCDLELLVTWYLQFHEYPNSISLYRYFLYLEWEHIGNFDYEKDIPKECFNVAWELFRYIINELTED